MTIIPEIELERMLTVLVEVGIVDSDVLRNFLILKEYKELRKPPNSLKCWQAREKLSEKYFLDDRAIQYIIYEERKKKEAMFKIDYKNEN